MRSRTILLSLLILTIAFSAFLSSCGAPPANQNTANNQNGSRTNTNSTNSTNANDSTKALGFCSEAIDKTIVQQIRIFVEEDPRLREQRRHINFYSKDCVVHLNGYTLTWPDFQKLHAKINVTENVKKIDLSHFDGPRTALAAQPAAPACDLTVTKPCGEICIPKDAICEIIEKTDPKATPTPTP